MDQIFDTIIIGGGPAGVAAGVYAARKEMKTLLIAESFGGQSIVSGSIENWIGEKNITGVELAKKLEEHIKAYPQNVQILEGERATVVTALKSPDPKKEYHFEVKTGSGGIYLGQTVIIASGARRKKLGVPGEDQFSGKGVSYCSTCDAPLFRNKKVAVVGGGNAGLEAVHDLIRFAAEIYLIANTGTITGDPATYDEVKSDPKLKSVILGVSVKEIIGDQFVRGLKYLDPRGVQQSMEVEGVFVEIGSTPNSELVRGWVDMNSHGEIIIDAKHATTSQPGIFACGDVTDDPYKQNNISVGDGVRAALAAYNYLLNKQKVTPSSG